MDIKLTEEQRQALLKQMTKHDGEAGGWSMGSQVLRERNAKIVRKHSLNNKETKEFRESMKRRFSIDPLTDDGVNLGSSKFPVMKESFSWKKFRGQLEDQMKEADTGTIYPLFLVAGLLTNVIGMYNLIKTSYQDWVTVTPTNLLDTPVAPLHGLSFPREVGEQMPYPVATTAALSLKFHARKYGTMYEVTKELLEDDQSGQFKQQTGMLGEYLQLLTEVLVYGRLASVTGAAYNGFTPGTSETQPSGETSGSYPWCTPTGGTNNTGLIGGGFTKLLGGAAAFNTANFELALENLNQQKNLLGIHLMVSPNRILVSPKFMFDAAVILNSAYYPGGAQSAGVTGGAFSINPLKGIADLTVARLMFDNTGVAGNLSKAWYVVDDSKPWFQLVLRTPVSVEQENPMSGQSFERDVMRFKANTRCIADFVDPRFAMQGSDGSV